MGPLKLVYLVRSLWKPSWRTIAGLESCVDCLPNQAQKHSLQALSTVVMELMQTYGKDDGVVGVDDLDRWSVDSDAFGFLSTVSSTVSVEALKQVSRFPAKSLYQGPLNTDLILWNSTRSSANRIDIAVSLFAWLGALQSLRELSILLRPETLFWGYSMVFSYLFFLRHRLSLSV